MEAGSVDAARAWPEPAGALPMPARRRRAQAPALALRLGPFTVPLSRPPPPAPPLDDGGAVAALPPAPGPAPSALEQLRQVLAQREPRLAHRLATTGEALDDGCLRRWLAARGGVEAAAAGILAHAAWREALVGASSSGVTEASIADELAARKVCLQGLDSGGCPVVVVQAARHDMTRRDLQQTKRLIAYVLDSSCATSDRQRNPGGRICCLFDLSGLRPRNLDVKALAAIFDMLQHHFPERLDSLYFLNAPLLFWGVWRCVSPFVQPATRRKIHFVAGAAGRAALLARVPPEVLPVRYGGASEMVPIDGAMTAWRRRQVAAAAAGAQDAASTSGGSGGSSSSSGVGGLRRRAGAAAHATRRFLHGRLVRPVGGAAAGAARALRHHHSQLLRRHGGGAQRQLSEQQRSLLAQVVLTHVLLVGLLLRMLQRVLLRRSAPAAAPKQLEPPAAPAKGAGAPPAAAQLGEPGGSQAAAPAGPASEA